MKSQVKPLIFIVLFIQCSFSAFSGPISDSSLVPLPKKYKFLSYGFSAGSVLPLDNYWHYNSDWTTYGDTIYGYDTTISKSVYLQRKPGFTCGFESAWFFLNKKNYSLSLRSGVNYSLFLQTQENGKKFNHQVIGIDIGPQFDYKNKFFINCGLHAPVVLNDSLYSAGQFGFGLRYRFNNGFFIGAKVSVGFDVNSTHSSYSRDTITAPYTLDELGSYSVFNSSSAQINIGYDLQFKKTKRVKKPKVIKEKPVDVIVKKESRKERKEKEKQEKELAKNNGKINTPETTVTSNENKKEEKPPFVKEKKRSRKKQLTDSVSANTSVVEKEKKSAQDSLLLAQNQHVNELSDEEKKNKHEESLQKRAADSLLEIKEQELKELKRQNELLQRSNKAFMKSTNEFYRNLGFSDGCKENVYPIHTDWMAFFPGAGIVICIIAERFPVPEKRISDMKHKDPTLYYSNEYYRMGFKKAVKKMRNARMTGDTISAQGFWLTFAGFAGLLIVIGG